VDRLAVGRLASAPSSGTTTRNAHPASASPHRQLPLSTSVFFSKLLRQTLAAPSITHTHIHHQAQASSTPQTSSRHRKTTRSQFLRISTIQSVQSCSSFAYLPPFALSTTRPLQFHSRLSACTTIIVRTPLRCHERFFFFDLATEPAPQGSSLSPCRCPLPRNRRSWSTKPRSPSS
jgi:hypothetical protein